ncbi:DUF378 domain-containing protein [Aliiroseovarius crassostreae]|uniref:DUF378 domain-containing protein n=1 Tax=Aliiroseovarius crassostreae TaxID=154981 RepID=UPI0021F98A33|nr:DUF378 domain-containing protein [Aliiroseovarius crassostreae]UWQ06190.1 DUF378 domain-containing protein [Aliiroseovarius crassostreae]
MTYTHLITLILVCIGGVNWGLVGLANFDLVAALLGDMSILSRIVYLLVGVSAAYQLVGASRCLKAAA